MDIDNIVKVEAKAIGACTVSPRMLLLETKKPYIINPAHIECITGEWNKDKGEDGVRVYFASGNNIWFGREVARALVFRIISAEDSSLDLERIGDIDKFYERFEERVKAGPPRV